MASHQLNPAVFGSGRGTGQPAVKLLEPAHDTDVRRIVLHSSESSGVTFGRLAREIERQREREIERERARMRASDCHGGVLQAFPFRI